MSTRHLVGGLLASKTDAASRNAGTCLDQSARPRFNSGTVKTVPYMVFRQVNVSLSDTAHKSAAGRPR